MATKITTNDHAPDDKVKYCLGSVDFELAPGDEYETTSRAAIADANAHPWLTVVSDPELELSVEYKSKSVPYEDDVLSAPNSQAWDADKLREYQEAHGLEAAQPVAIESGLDQGKAVEEGGVAVTLAADDSADEPAKDTKTKTSKESK